MLYSSGIPDISDEKEFWDEDQSRIYRGKEEIKSLPKAKEIMYGVYYKLEKVGVEDYIRGDIATAVIHSKFLAFWAFNELRTARKGVIRCTNVDGVGSLTKLKIESRGALDSIMDYWASRWEPYYLGEVELKNSDEKAAVEEVLSSLRDVFLEYKSKLSDGILQYDLEEHGAGTPSIIKKPEEYVALTDSILKEIEESQSCMTSVMQDLSNVDIASFTTDEDSFTKAIDYETKLVIDKITSYVEESKKVVSSCREECLRILESGTANISDASAGSDTSKYEVEHLKEDFELLSKRIEKLEQAQQPSNSGSINEKLDVLSRKVKELESKFGNLKKIVYDVINKENSSAVEELGIGNVEEVEFTNSESSSQEDDSKSNRLNDAFADFDKQLADLQEIFNA